MSSEEIKNAINIFLDKYAGTMSKMFTIVQGNALDLAKLDMNEFTSDVIFIAHPLIEQGKAYIMQDGELKESLYRFSLEHPDKVFRGTKEGS